jgi:predicted nuclease of predicted toxin-antitoxin system
MRVLLDECLPAGLRRDLPGHDVTTVQRQGWAGTQNGALLALARRARIEAFVTIDKGLEFQQRVAALPFGVVALRARSNDIVDLRPLMPAVLTALTTLRAGQLGRVL